MVPVERIDPEKYGPAVGVDERAVATILGEPTRRHLGRGSSRQRPSPDVPDQERSPPPAHAHGLMVCKVSYPRRSITIRSSDQLRHHRYRAGTGTADDERAVRSSIGYFSHFLLHGHVRVFGGGDCIRRLLGADDGSRPVINGGNGSLILCPQSRVVRVSRTGWTDTAVGPVESLWLERTVPGRLPRGVRLFNMLGGKHYWLMHTGQSDPLGDGYESEEESVFGTDSNALSFDVDLFKVSTGLTELPSLIPLRKGDKVTPRHGGGWVVLRQPGCCYVREPDDKLSHTKSCSYGFAVQNRVVRGVPVGVLDRRSDGQLAPPPIMVRNVNKVLRRMAKSCRTISNKRAAQYSTESRDVVKHVRWNREVRSEVSRKITCEERLFLVGRSGTVCCDIGCGRTVIHRLSEEMNVVIEYISEVNGEYNVRVNRYYMTLVTYHWWLVGRWNGTGLMSWDCRAGLGGCDEARVERPRREGGGRQPERRRVRHARDMRHPGEQ
eukprot:IDg5952t1